MLFWNFFIFPDDMQIKIICIEIILVLATENFYNILSSNTLSTNWADAICTRYLSNACVAKNMSTCFKTAHPSPIIIILNFLYHGMFRGYRYDDS